ncbi:MAG: DoxX family protein [Sandaracinaceae bacterium]
MSLVIAGGIANVWLLRFGKSTRFRGGNASNMKEEFAAYGLPGWFMYVVGATKLALAVALVVGIWVPWLVAPAGYAMAALMAGALAMHLKVGDPPLRFLPAGTMLALSLLVALL